MVAGLLALGLLTAWLLMPHRNAAAHYNPARQFEAAGELSAAITHYNQFVQYAGPEETAFVADVRLRVSALAARLK